MQIWIVLKIMQIICIERIIMFQREPDEKDSFCFFY